MVHSTIMRVAILAAVVAGLAGCGMGDDIRAARNAADEYMVAIAAGNERAVRAATCATAEAPSLDAFGEIVEHDIDSFSVTRGTEGTLGSVQVGIRRRDGTQARLLLALRPEDGEWRVCHHHLVSG